MDWERNLELLRRQGWGYGYGKYLDNETGDENYLVNLTRGNRRLSIIRPTIEEAVRTISRLAEEDDDPKLSGDFSTPSEYSTEF